MKKSYQKNKSERAKIILTILVAAFVFAGFPKNAFASDITAENLTYLVNKERIYYGLAPLKVDPDLSSAAKNKSKDMLNRNYFEHYAFGLTPWNFIKSSGYNYLYAGENLAMDFQTSEGMVSAWMNSPLHRKNILSEDYEDVGFGVVKGVYYENGSAKETTIVTNMLGRKKPFIVEVFNRILNNIQTLFSR